MRLHSIPSLLAVLASFAALSMLALAIHRHMNASTSAELAEIDRSISARFSPGVAPQMRALRRAIESPDDTPDRDLLKWFIAAQGGTDEDRRRAAMLFLGLAIDWPLHRVEAHRATLVHIAGEMLANANGDESIAWAGLAMACELNAQDALRDLADGFAREAKNDGGEAWKETYARAYARTPAPPQRPPPSP